MKKLSGILILCLLIVFGISKAIKSDKVDYLLLISISVIALSVLALVYSLLKAKSKAS